MLKSIVWFAKNHWLEFYTTNPYPPYYWWKKWEPPNMVVNLAEKTPFPKLLTTAQKPTMSLQFKAQGPKVPCQTWNYHMTPHPRGRVLSPIRRGIIRNIGGRNLGIVEWLGALKTGTHYLTVEKQSELSSCWWWWMSWCQGRTLQTSGSTIDSRA